MVIERRIGCRAPSSPSSRLVVRLAHTSSRVTPATAASAPPTRMLRPFRRTRLPSNARSITSPARRAHSQRVGRRRTRIPTPALSSRTPSARIRLRVRAPSEAPIRRATWRGAVSCARPRPTLNQPSARATLDDRPLARLVAARCAARVCGADAIGPRRCAALGVGGIGVGSLETWFIKALPRAAKDSRSAPPS